VVLNQDDAAEHAPGGLIVFAEFLDAAVGTGIAPGAKGCIDQYCLFFHPGLLTPS
jgi:hypothetical protein